MKRLVLCLLEKKLRVARTSTRTLCCDCDDRANFLDDERVRLNGYSLLLALLVALLVIEV